eukprot:1297853-Amphidinium_carterae.1
MKVPLAASEEERRYHNLTHYPYKEWCEHCVRGLAARTDTTRREKLTNRARPWCSWTILSLRTGNYKFHYLLL